MSKPVQARSTTVRLTPARRALLDRLLDRLLDLEPEARKRELAAVADSHPRMHFHLSRLVEASTEPTQYLETLFGRVGSAALDSIQPEPSTLPPGTRIGDWRLIEAVGAGGMGQVYRAERADGAFEMSVAVKFIRTRDDGKLNEQLAVERRLLARLDHPNIARLIDGGTLSDGQTYLVMEWVEGEDWNRCRERLIATEHQGLGHFIEVANAIQHAHQRRVVHGDIKPANIRIMANGRVRLLDFGVARLLSDNDDAIDQHTLALTPAFAAPEQLAGEPASTQSDLYALGMLLRWLLTGQISSEESDLKASKINIARPQAVAAIIRHATEKDPNDRYNSVSEMIRDVQALIEKRPVSVMPNSTLSRLLLWARRHRVAAAAASLAVISIVGGTAGLAWQERIVRAERDLARFEAERAGLIREQLTMLFREAGQSIEGEEVSARDLLAESVRLAEDLHADDPEILAAIKAFLGEVYIAMDDYAAAEPLLAVLVDNPELSSGSDLLRAVIMADLAQIRLRQGESQQAVDLLDQSLALLSELPSDNRSREADIIAIRGQALRGLGRWDEAIASAEQGLALARQVEAPPSRLLATIENNLATTLIYAGRGTEAMPYLKAALDNWRGLGREDSSNALTIMTNLASLLHQQGDLNQAEVLYREAIERRSQRFGESGSLGAAYLNLGTLLAQRYELQAARQHVEQGIALIERFEGGQTVNLARALLVQARVDQAADEYQTAHERVLQAEQLFSETLGDTHLFTQVAKTQRAIVKAQAERAASQDLFEQISTLSGQQSLEAVIDRLRQMQPQSNRFLAQALCEQAKHALYLSSPGTALESAQQCLELRREITVESSWEIVEARAIVAAASVAVGNDQAMSDLNRARADLASILGEDHPNVKWCERWL